MLLKVSAMLKAGFLLLTVALAILLFMAAAFVGNKAFTRVSELRRFKIKVALVLGGWLGYVSLLSVKGVFASASLPPRIPLLLIIPALIFFAYFFTNSKFRRIIDATPASLPVYFQSFRIIVELLILGLFLQDVLPKAATFEGSNYDIAIGITAPVIAYLTFTMGRLSKTIALLWNFAGLATLLIVVVILLSHAYFYEHFGEKESILSRGLGIFPYTFLAGFFMPIAVFMHIYSIIKTRKLMR
jgi:hypothetical protein